MENRLSAASFDLSMGPGPGAGRVPGAPTYSDAPAWRSRSGLAQPLWPGAAGLTVSGRSPATAQCSAGQCSAGPSCLSRAFASTPSPERCGAGYPASPPFPPVSARPRVGPGRRRDHIPNFEVVTVTYMRPSRKSSPDERDCARPVPGPFSRAPGSGNQRKTGGFRSQFRAIRGARRRQTPGPGPVPGARPIRWPRPRAGLPRSRPGRSLVESVLNA